MTSINKFLINFGFSHLHNVDYIHNRHNQNKSPTPMRMILVIVIPQLNLKLFIITWYTRGL